MTTLDNRQYELALEAWITSCKDFSSLQRLIPTNYVFNLSAEQIEWLRQNNANSQFSVEIGVYNNQLIMILCPLDQRGQKVFTSDYPYSVLSALSQDITLTQTQQYVVVNNAVISTDLRRIDNTADTSFPVYSMPMMAQDKAVDAIEKWRDQGSNWFYYECTEQGGSRIFNKFYVPSSNINPPEHDKSPTSIVCAFGLKYSDIYQRMMVTLIFISFYGDRQDNGSITTISNTYDWSQPSPPFLIAISDATGI
ncbi:MULTISPECIES: hypothetical protein [Chryseobacterium]|uniref:Uncharacterized protein n=1 Tax=Chryseobacterium camelliae TaxID=1265445 RepID=A0ABU0TK03_9FLAO|nr:MULTISPECIES: hypothetical protein [Chryseobacterium]MDT3408770.1 hypothetical protein [Pseudacidovorax intermedius]MDQ1097375.1 hypothetical protein [Chryseobacterium camelliae]MDQ1101306.1 hypothetical protein [Chryseobacterium sp. SORGH_AS_1048]MDR6084751.1 hypothetical protein [Chryseobacterium sp. SORGH_AS_0909]MDR6133024.1 hypothetical protein [Chryseobacterium sp. SORGH_AS_1175]